MRTRRTPGGNSSSERCEEEEHRTVHWGGLRGQMESMSEQKVMHGVPGMTQEKQEEGIHHIQLGDIRGCKSHITPACSSAHPGFMLECNYNHATINGKVNRLVTYTHKDWTYDVCQQVYVFNRFHMALCTPSDLQVCLLWVFRPGTSYTGSAAPNRLRQTLGVRCPEVARDGRQNNSKYVLVTPVRESNYIHIIYYLLILLGLYSYALTGLIWCILEPLSVAFASAAGPSPALRPGVRLSHGLS